MLIILYLDNVQLVLGSGTILQKSNLVSDVF